MLFMGVDGGGSTLRVALVDAELHVLAQVERGAANPNTIGKQASAALIQSAMGETLAAAGKNAAAVTAVALGVAGAAHLQAWLYETVLAALPYSRIVTSTDFEIALVGARGERLGVLVLAGTGSVAFGVNHAGDKVQVGGWGYLLGDEGSGYWIGLQALKALVHHADQHYARASEAASGLPRRVMETLALSAPHEIIGWLYGQPRVRDVARLTDLVFEAAAEGDNTALEIIDSAVAELSRLVETVRRRLRSPGLPIAFAGGLLSAETLLSQRLARTLALPDVPHARYSPVIGAALLAKLTHGMKS